MIQIFFYYHSMVDDHSINYYIPNINLMVIKLGGLPELHSSLLVIKCK
jgi:hypothetical protein